MKLILMRHAQAESSQDDFQRGLTKEGEEDSEKMAQFLYSCKWNINQIRVSPLVRSYETGKNLARSLAKLSSTHILEPIKDDRLRPEGFSSKGYGPIEEILSSPDMTQVKQSCVWILHAPDISYAASYLTGMPIGNYFFPLASMLALNLQTSIHSQKAAQIWQIYPECIKRFFLQE